MTSDAHQLIAGLAALGVTLAADGDDGLAYDAPAGVLTSDLRAELVLRKPAVLAILTGHLTPSGVPGIVWSPLGGVCLTDPPDLRALCQEVAAAHGYPRLCLPHRPAEAVAAGREAWRAFVSTALVADLLFAMDALDDLATGEGGMLYATPDPQASTPVAVPESLRRRAV